MRAEFYRPDDVEDVVGVARWDGRTVHVDAPEEEMRSRISRVFRLTPVVADDPAFRPLGTRGEAVLEPGTLDWFRAAAVTRVGEGLSVRLVPEVQGQGGWDPASAYRTFRQAVATMVARSQPQEQPTEQAGETRPEGEAG